MIYLTSTKKLMRKTNVTYNKTVTALRTFMDDT